MKEILNRIQAPTPDFFKKVIKVAIGLGAIGATIVGLPTAVPFIVFPPILSTIGGYFIAASTVAASVAKLAKVDVEDTAQP